MTSACRGAKDVSTQDSSEAEIANARPAEPDRDHSCVGNNAFGSGAFLQGTGSPDRHPPLFVDFLDVENNVPDDTSKYEADSLTRVRAWLNGKNSA